MVGARRLRRTVVAIVAAAAAFVVPARAGDTGCPAAWPPRAPDSSAAFDANALLRLREIGFPGPGLGGSSPLAVSPDGKQMAFFVSQAVPATNDVCETLLLLDVATRDRVRVVDSGGTGIRREEVLRGVRRPSGIFDVNIPVWSPDGRSLAYRKRIGGRTEVWRADLDEGSPRLLVRADQDVEAVGWSGKDARVLFTVRPGRADAAKARDEEARRGYLYDARILPHLAPEPQLPAELAEEVLVVPATGGSVLRASDSDVVGFRRLTPLGVHDVGPVAGPPGLRAGTEPLEPGYFAGQKLWVEQNGHRVYCRAEACSGALRAVWWHRGEVMFLRRVGWRRETSAVHGWDPSSGRLRTLVRTTEAIEGCVGTARQVHCLAEQSRRPRRIVALDPRTGSMRDVFDPNPEIEIGQLPAVERLKWRNDRGLEAWGDLVIPPGTPPSGGWPLVIVQYSSEGFLRGGTGNEYPIFPLAGRGIAVLSFEAPDRVSSLGKGATDARAMVAAGNAAWADRRSIHDSLMRGIDLAIARGDIDATHIGISGLSDGSTTARFALINADRFAAAAISSCCLEPHSTMTHGGIAQADWFRSTGYPDASRPDPEFWQPASMAMNAARMDTPLLMQLSDDEYIQALETFTALREHGKPAEMYVFPGEHHNKWQPVHRAAIYERNLDWFSFWLQNRIDPDPAKAEQYRRWNAMRARTAEVPLVAETGG